MSLSLPKSPSCSRMRASTVSFRTESHGWSAFADHDGTRATPPIVIAAGGTGGHVFPAEALAVALVARGHKVALMTDARSSALNSPAFGGGERFVLKGAGIAGRGAVRAGAAVLSLAAGIVQARRALTRLRPAVVVGFGGYPSVPPVLAARMLRRRPAIILHEQNGVLGRANRFLTRFADTLALSLSETARVPANAHTEITGNPVRPGIAAIAPYKPPTDELRLLVLGGSLGARVFSDVVPDAVTALPAPLRARLRVTQQCRAEDLARVRAAYAAAAIPADLAPFFADIPARIEAAHLVVARAGASTVAELAAAGRPALLVPLPHAIDDHQSANARALGGARVIAQRDLTQATLADALASLLNDPAQLAHAAAAARASAWPEAAERLADLVERHLAQEARA